MAIVPDLVGDTSANRLCRLICFIFLGFFILLCIILFVVWLSLRPHHPIIHIHDFSVPGLGQTSGSMNAHISFNVTARNPNHHVGIFYDSMDGNVYYKDQRIGSTQLSSTPFYERPKKTRLVSAVLSGARLEVNNERWMEFTNGLAAGRDPFRLEIISTIRYKISTWVSKRHSMHANCGAVVGPDGLILPTFRDRRCHLYFV